MIPGIAVFVYRSPLSMVVRGKESQMETTFISYIEKKYFFLYGDRIKASRKFFLKRWSYHLGDEVLLLSQILQKKFVPE